MMLRKFVYNGEVEIPENIEELERVIKENDKITLRGGGRTKLKSKGKILSLEKLDNIEIDEDKREAYVEAGVLLGDLQKELEKKELEFPLKTFFDEISTIGGLIARNIGGFRGIKYKQIQDLVKEIEIIDSDGSLVSINRTDFSDFFGMNGMTGVIVKARLKLIKKPKRSLSLFKSSSIEKIIEFVKKLKLMDVSMIEFLSKEVSELVGLERAYHLIVEFEDERGKKKDKEYDEIIEKLFSLYSPLCIAGYTDIEDIRLFLDKLPYFLEYLEARKIPVFGHIGTGIFHPVLPKDFDKKQLLDYVKKLRGKVYADYGFLNKKQYFDDTDKKLMKRVKMRRDEKKKFNDFIEFKEDG